MIIWLMIINLFLEVTAIQQHNLSGTWILQKKEHVSGPNYANALPKQVSMIQSKDSIIIESIEDDDLRVRQSIPANGQPFSYVSSKSHRKYIKSIKWSQDKMGFTFTTVFHVPNSPNEVELTRVETWTLSPDGKELVINKKSVETRSENWETNGVYVRKFMEEL